MLAEVLYPTSVDVHSLPSKIKRYFKNRKKYQLVYSKESHLMGFLLRIRSWVNWKWGKKSVWNCRGKETIYNSEGVDINDMILKK